MKIVLAFDSYKGCLSAADVCDSAREGILSVFPSAEVLCVPLSDGGEGLVQSILSASAGRAAMSLVRVRVHGPLMEWVDAEYAVTTDGHTAVMEMASACGLPLVPIEQRDPTKTTTYGLGEMINDAVRRGVSHIILGIGGSATCDAGQGMLSSLNQPLKGVTLSVACDVTNPLYGPNGAAHVFAPQKGASPQQVEWLEQQIHHFAHQTEHKGLATPDDALRPGTGAAGGLGYTLLTYLKATLKPGIELVLDAAGFDHLIEGADLVITGEGSSDLQTLMGKVPFGVLQRSKRQGIPVVLASGALSHTDALLSAGFSRLLCINEGDTRPLSTLLSPDVAKENIRKRTQFTVHSLIASRSEK